MKRYLVILSIFILALILRVGSVYDRPSGIESDEVEYDRLAAGIASGNGYIASTGLPTSHRPPLYPALMALIYSIFGHNYMIVKMVQALAGAATVILIYLIAENIFNRTTAVISALFASFYAPFILCAGLLYTETFFIFLLILITYLAVKLRPTIPAFLILGLLCGALTLLRSNGFIMVPIVALGMLLGAGNIKMFPARISLSVLALVLSFLAAIVPWSVRNYAVHKKVVLVSTNAGLNMYQATIKTPGRIYAIDPADPVEKMAMAAPDESSRNEIYSKAAMNFYMQYPIKAAKMILVRFLFLWNVIDWEVAGGKVINYQYIFIMPFAFLGILFGMKTKKDISIILLIVGGFMSFILLFPGTARYRMPLDGYLIILGSYGIYEFVARRRKKIYPVIITSTYLALTYVLYKYSIHVKYLIRAIMEKAGLW